MDNSKKYYLINDGEVYLYSDCLPEVIETIIDLGIHTYFYEKEINSVENFNNWTDWHEGICSFIDKPMDNKGCAHDTYVILEQYVECYPDILEIVNNFREKIDLPPLIGQKKD